MVKFSVTYPIVAEPYDRALFTQAGIVRFSQAAERAGFDGISFTDHPAPTDRWLRAGGHDALDPFVALSFCAAVTERLRLIPNILVLPYRNPFVVAKAVATLDALSGRTLHARGGDWLSPGRIPRARRRLRRTERPVRRGARSPLRGVERGRLRIRGSSLPGTRADRQPQAGGPPAGVDRRQQPARRAGESPGSATVGSRSRLPASSRPRPGHRRSRPSKISPRCWTSCG